MKISALDRKLLRELNRLKGQIITIALVIASGITSFVALRGTHASLETSRAAYYDRFRFAHVFVRVERAPEALARRIERLPGVELVQTRIAEEVTLPIEGMGRPPYGRLLSLPPSGQPATNALFLRKGRLPEPGKDDEVVLLESFAQAHGLLPGHHVPVLIDGKLRKLLVVGVALSPEFVYAIRPGAIADDPKRYAVLWMERGALANAFRLEGAFNDLSLRLQPGASSPSVRETLDRMLAPYGSAGAIDRKDQISNRILSGELGQLQMLASMIPVIFLVVAAFLLNLVLGRLIRLQRHELATLKAVGYTNVEVARHYLALVAIIMVPGGVLGLLGGWVLGKFLMSAYQAVFRFPELVFHLSPALAATALVVSAVAALTGALFAIRAAAKLPPAEAMRPPAPARYKQSLIERLGFAAFLGPSAMMVFREVRRRPLRTALSAVGIAGAVALVILGRFGMDSITRYFEATFRREQRQDLSVMFAKPVAPRAVGALARWPGVSTAEGLRAVPVRARHEQRTRDAVLLGIPDGATLRRIIGRDLRDREIPDNGVAVTKKLAEVLGLRLGDRIDLGIMEGERRSVRPVVTALIDEATGLQVYARATLVAELTGDLGAVSIALLKVESQAREDVEQRLRQSPQVIDVADAVGDMKRLREMNASFIDIWTAVSIALAASVIFGVVYNNARISLAARSRDLASLRVLGFSRREISRVLLGSLAVEVALAVPLGLYFGRVWAEQFMSSVDQETFRWAITIEPRTYLLAAGVAMGAAAISALLVRRSLDRLDLISVLKTRE